MFKINPAPTFKQVVNLTVPGAEPQAVEFEFKHKTRTGLDLWQKSIAGKTEREVIPEFIVGWSRVLNDSGDQEPWSVEAFMLLAENYPAAALEVYGAYLKGLTESRAKN